VPKICLVRLDNNKYSVNAGSVGQPVKIHVCANRIVICQDGRIGLIPDRKHVTGMVAYSQPSTIVLKSADTKCGSAVAGTERKLAPSHFDPHCTPCMVEWLS
jgi:hypothetical protein